MEGQKLLPFPYEFEELEPSEKAEIQKLFYYPKDYVRVGPKGFLLLRPYIEEAENIYNLPLRPSDVYVTSYQRSGTTWTQELVWLIANDFDYEKALVLLTTRYTFVEKSVMYDSWRTICIKNIDTFDEEKKEKILKHIELMSQPVTETLASEPSPRFIKSHLPMSLLPPTLVDTAKVIYVARDPRDVAVSCYHICKLMSGLHIGVEFKKFWELFMNGRFTLTPYFEHVKEAWELRDHPNMLFLFYEELSFFNLDLPASVRRVANFLGKKVTEEQVTRLCDHLSFENFKKNKAVNNENLWETDKFIPGSNEAFIRKGKSNGWRDYFDEDMTQQAEKWITDNLRDTDLRYPHM